MRRIWVAELLISPRTARKIQERHGVTVGETHDALVCVTGLPFVWDQDAARGERALVQVSIRGRPVTAVLYVAPNPLGDVWNLGSIYFTSK